MTAVGAPVELAGPKKGWFSRLHIGLHTDLIVLIISWALPTLELLVTSVLPGAKDVGPAW